MQDENSRDPVVDAGHSESRLVLQGLGDQLCVGVRRFPHPAIEVLEEGFQKVQSQERLGLNRAATD